MLENVLQLIFHHPTDALEDYPLEVAKNQEIFRITYSLTEKDEKENVVPFNLDSPLVEELGLHELPLKGFSFSCKTEDLQSALREIEILFGGEDPLFADEVALSKRFHHLTENQSTAAEYREYGELGHAFRMVDLQHLRPYAVHHGIVAEHVFFDERYRAGTVQRFVKESLRKLELSSDVISNEPSPPETTKNRHQLRSPGARVAMTERAPHNARFVMRSRDQAILL